MHQVLVRVSQGMFIRPTHRLKFQLMSSASRWKCHGTSSCSSKGMCVSCHKQLQRVRAEFGRPRSRAERRIHQHASSIYLSLLHLQWTRLGRDSFFVQFPRMTTKSARFSFLNETQAKGKRQLDEASHCKRRIDLEVWVNWIALAAGWTCMMSTNFSGETSLRPRRRVSLQKCSTNCSIWDVILQVIKYCGLLLRTDHLSTDTSSFSFQEFSRLFFVCFLISYVNY